MLPRPWPDVPSRVVDEQHAADETPEFGPGGYLPDRASRRARKIVLRAPMGIQWVIGSLVVGLVVVVAGWFALRDTTPSAPFVEVPAELVEAPGGVALWSPPGVADEALVVTVGSRTRVFAWPGDQLPVVCEESGLLEAADGAAWRLTGRGVGGTPSLAEHPLIVDDGVLYADPTTTIDLPTSDPSSPDTSCS